ncbi:type 4a pilus biogenesis protein PilO [Candidatus Daviesbacteria bacterium]|nr:type 4a pilus biogenesis protein PilO [Candidatus Daviesbacteria bacterium]
MNKEALGKFYYAYRLYIFPLVIGLSCIILIILVIYPQISKLISNRKVEGELKDKTILLEAKAEQLESFDAQALSKRVDYVLSSYPAEKDFATTVGLIPQIAANSGFSVTSLNFASSSSEGEKNYRVSLDVIGPGSLIDTFVSDIESSARLMRVSNLEISAGRSGDEINATIGIDVLYSSLPAEFGTVDTPLPEFSAKDEDVIAKLAQTAPAVATVFISSGPKGKTNPFE